MRGALHAAGYWRHNIVLETDRMITLEDCLLRIRQLEEENAHLRQAAKTFGELAERLKVSLDRERRWRTHPQASRPAS
jgi:hypothetical protein